MPKGTYNALRKAVCMTLFLQIHPPYDVFNVERERVRRLTRRRPRLVLPGKSTASSTAVAADGSERLSGWIECMRAMVLEGWWQNLFSRDQMLCMHCIVYE